MEYNKAYLGDCLTLMQKLEPKSIDLILTSPPYNMNLRVLNGKYCSRQVNVNEFSDKYIGYDDNMSMDEYYKWSVKIISECLRISLLTFYNIQMITGNKPALFKLMGHFSEKIKELIIWDKGHGQPAMQKGVLNSRFELLLVLSDNDAIKRGFDNACFNRGELDNLWQINREQSKHKTHGAVFPVELAKRVIQNFTKSGDTVLDIFAGTGTTGVACLELNRNFILIENNPSYLDIINSRLQDTRERLGLIKDITQVKEGQARQLGLF